MSYLKSLFIVALAALSLAACGGGSGSSTTVGAVSTGSVGIIFADSSAVDAALAEVVPQGVLEPASADAQLLLTVTSVVLKGDAGDQTIFSGTEIIDLYELKDSLELFFVNESVLPGTFDKIRLYADNVSLCVPVPPASESALATLDCEDVKLPSGKIDFNPRGPFTIAAGDVVIVTLDIHANKSLKLTENPRKLILRPVVFVDIESKQAFDEGLVRVSGVVAAAGSDQFTLCSAMFATPVAMPATQAELNQMCLDVLITDRTGVFNDEGEPVEVSELMVGDPVTVIGLLQLTPANGVAPAVAALAEGDTPTPFRIIGVVVEGGGPGVWERYLGMLLSAVVPDPDMPGSGVFEFQLAGADTEAPVPVDGAAVAAEVAEPVVVYARVYPQTRIFAISLAEGLVEITAADLAEGDRALIEAAMAPEPVEPPPVDPADEPEPTDEEPVVQPEDLRVSLMLVLQDAMDPGPGPDLLRGSIESVTPVADTGNEGGLSVISEETSNAVCVNSYSDTEIYLLVGADDSIQAITAELGELQAGDRIAVAGDRDGASGCFDAALMIARGPLNP